jgi:hypothetical protein
MACRCYGCARGGSVHNNMLGEGGAKAIAPLVEKMPRLEDFRFTTTRVPEPGGIALSTSLGFAT